MRGHVYLLVGPSGGGKTTLIRTVTAPGHGFTFIPSTTSRPPRPGEVAGSDYHFVDDKAFSTLVGDGEFLEWQRVHGFRYGSSRRRIEAVVAAGLRGITSADILGAFKIKAAMPADVTTVFVTPSHLDTLRQRISRRAPVTAEELDRRLARVAMEMQLAHACDALILNDELDLAHAELEALTGDQERRAAARAHFGRLPVVRAVEVEPPPQTECGTRFCVSACETPRDAAERVLHQWWWECHPSATRFALPGWELRRVGQREEHTERAVLDVTRWVVTLQAPLDAPA